MMASNNRNNKKKLEYDDVQECCIHVSDLFSNFLFKKVDSKKDRLCIQCSEHCYRVQERLEVRGL